MPPGESRFREKSPRSSEAVDRPPRSLVPSNIECKKPRKELKLAVRQVVVNPPSHCLPRCSRSPPVDQPRHDDRRQRAHAAILATSIPGVTGPVLFVRGATQSMSAPKFVDLWRAIRRSNGEAAECCLQGFEQILAEPAASLNRQLRIIGQIRHSLDCCDFAEQEIPHKEGL